MASYQAQLPGNAPGGSTTPGPFPGASGQKKQRTLSGDWDLADPADLKEAMGRFMLPTTAGTILARDAMRGISANLQSLTAYERQNYFDRIRGSFRETLDKWSKLQDFWIDSVQYLHDRYWKIVTELLDVTQLRDDSKEALRRDRDQLAEELAQSKHDAAVAREKRNEWRSRAKELAAALSQVTNLLDGACDEVDQLRDSAWKPDFYTPPGDP